MYHYNTFLTFAFPQFWPEGCLASRYFAIRASNLVPTCFDTKRILRHESGAYFSIKQITAAYKKSTAHDTCDVVLLTDVFISESMLHDILVDAGATSITIETPPHDNPRWWLADKMSDIWDSVANNKLRYYHMGKASEDPENIMAITAQNWVIQNASSIQDSDSFASELNGFALECNMTKKTRENHLWVPPEFQLGAYQLWLQAAWHNDYEF
jgi:hypothetical protein